MTTSEPQPRRGPNTFQRAEERSRRVLLIVSAGVLAWCGGSLLRNELTDVFAESIEAIDVPAVALLTYWFLARLWVLLALTPLSYLGGRFLVMSALAFVVPAAVVGELSSLALAFANSGGEFLFHSVEDVAVWVISFVLACLPSVFAFRSGARAHAASMSASRLTAESQRAQYDAFVARAAADGKPALPQEPPPKTEG
jgi:hypothetical protein